MAKVEGPLMSIEARGKLADSLVFFPWKGRHVVRRWLKPVNKESVLQGYVRVSLKAIGKFIAKIACTAKSGVVDSRLYVLCTSKAPAGMNWNAFLGQGFLDLVQAGGTFVTASLTALIAAYSALGTAELTAFRTNATALGLADFTFGYGYTTNIEAGCILYFGALAAIAQSVSAGAPYNTVIGSWVASDVNAFKSDITATD
jgi:hypothetical protein